VYFLLLYSVFTTVMPLTYCSVCSLQHCPWHTVQCVQSSSVHDILLLRSVFTTALHLTSCHYGLGTLSTNYYNVPYMFTCKIRCWFVQPCIWIVATV